MLFDTHSFPPSHGGACTASVQTGADEFEDTAQHQEEEDEEEEEEAVTSYSTEDT